MALQSFVHLSDLHFGPATGRRVVDPWMRYVPLLNGYVGEDPATLRYLIKAVTDLRLAEPNLGLIVTGDLTAYGEPSQFDRAAQFLGLPGQPPTFVGLNFPWWRELTIPGNHDHWPGIPYWSLGGKSTTVRNWFPPTYVSPPIDLGRGRELVFIHLDGDVDVRPWSPERFYAVGSFTTGLTQLEQDPKLAMPADHQIRVLLLHYSYQFRGHQVRSRWLSAQLSLEHLAIDDPSRQALETFTRSRGIRVLLSGHVHNPFFVGPVPGLAPQGRQAMEARCGSSAQRMAAHPADNGRKRFKNSFFVHRIEASSDGSALYWDSEVHATEMSGTGGFQPASSFLVQPAPRHRIQVWP